MSPETAEVLDRLRLYAKHKITMCYQSEGDPYVDGQRHAYRTMLVVIDRADQLRSRPTPR